MSNKLISHHNLIGHEINDSLSNYMDDPLDRTIYCRKLHQVLEPTKKECKNCPCLSGVEQGNGIECSWDDVLENEHVVEHKDRYKEYERVDILIKQGQLTPKPYDSKKWIYINSADNKYRFVLGEKGDKPLVCFGINPSTATPEDLDHTMRIVRKRALAEESVYNGYIMLNICPQRSTDPNGMNQAENDEAAERNLIEIENILKMGNVDIWAAWGNNIAARPYLKESLKKIIEIADKYNCRWLKAEDENKSGHPHHPTRLRSGAKLVNFNIKEYYKEIWGS